MENGNNLIYIYQNSNKAPYPLLETTSFLYYIYYFHFPQLNFLSHSISGKHFHHFLHIFHFQISSTRYFPVHLFYFCVPFMIAFSSTIPLYIYFAIILLNNTVGNPKFTTFNRLTLFMPYHIYNTLCPYLSP